jgi:hypothetical protein
VHQYYVLLLLTLQLHSLLAVPTNVRSEILHAIAEGCIVLLCVERPVSLLVDVKVANLCHTRKAVQYVIEGLSDPRRLLMLSV